MAQVKRYSGDIVASLRQKIEQAIDAQSDKTRQRQRAWQQFIGAPVGDEVEGRSAVQSRDVNSMVTAVSAQLAVSYNTDSLIQFQANNGDDEGAASAESRAVNKVVMDDNHGFPQIMAAVQNALLYGNGYLKCWWAIDKQIVNSTHKGMDPRDLPVLAESEPGKQRRLISYDPETETARLETTMSTNRLSIAAVSNDRFFIDPDHEEMDLAGCALCGEVHYMTRDELVRMGVEAKVVKALPATQKYTGTEQQTQHRQMGLVEPVVPQMEIVRVYEGYARLSFEEDDDRAYLYKCWIGDRTPVNDGWLLEPEPVARTPYACGSAFPVANRHMGEALADKLYQVQGAKTQLFRQWLDNIQNCSFGRFGAVVGQVEAADILTPRAGGIVRMKSPTAIVPIPTIDVGPSIKLNIEEWNQTRSEVGGASLDMIGAEMQIASDTAHGTERVYASKEILVSLMASNLSEMLRSFGLLAHEELRDGDGGPIQVKIAEKWTTVDPRQWQARTACNVTVAPSFGERMLQANTLAMGLQLYGQAMQAGLEGELVTKQGLYKMATDWLRLNLVDDPESYYIDPSSEQAQQAGQQKAQMSQQQMQQQAQILALPEQIKAQYERYKSDQKTAFDYFSAVLDAIVKANETETGGVIDVISARTQAETVQNANARSGSGAGNGAARNGAARTGGGKGNNGSGGGAGRTASEGD